MRTSWQKIATIFKNHWIIISLAFCLTMLVFYPVITFPFVAGEKYQGINVPPITDALYYMSRGKEILEGHNLGSSVLHEDKNSQDIYFMQTDRLLLLPFTLLGLGNSVNIVTVYAVYSFVGVFILVLLIYAFALRLSGNKSLSIAAAIFTIGGYEIIYNKTLFYSDFNIYGRTLFPYFSSIIFFAYLNFLVPALESGSRRAKLWATAFFGLLFYIYIFAWSFALALNGALLLLYVVRKDWVRLKRLGFIFGIGVALGLPMFWQMISFMTSPGGKELYLNRGTEATHAFIFSKIGFVTAIVFAWYSYRRRVFDSWWTFVLGLILAGWVALNQQVITGQILQYGHYYWYFIVPLSIIVVCVLIARLVRLERYQKIIAGILIGLAFINCAGGQYLSLRNSASILIGVQRYAPAINALKFLPASVVLMPNDIPYQAISSVTIYTNHDLFWADTVDQIPFQHRKDALFVYVYLNKNARADFARYLNDSLNTENGNGDTDLYGRYVEEYLSGFTRYTYRNHLAQKDPVLLRRRQEIIAELNDEYKKLTANPNNVVDLLKKYEVGYIVWDEQKHPEWDLSFIGGQKEILNNQGIHVYKI